MERTKKAFTLVEMLIVVVIIWLLAAVMMWRFQSFLQSARDSSRQAWLKNLSTSLEKYRVDYGDVFPSWSWEIKNTATNGLYLALVKSGNYIDQLPMDPVASRPLYASWSSAISNWSYLYQPLRASSSDNFGYLMLANTETPKWMNVVTGSTAWFPVKADPINDWEWLNYYSSLKCVSVVFSWSSNGCWPSVPNGWILKWQENQNGWWLVASWG